MHVVSRKRLRDFWQQHPDAEQPLIRWHKITERAQWASFADIKRDFPAADWVNGLVVFDIGGNKYRLIADVRFAWRRAFVRAVLTHGEYDKRDWQ